MNNTNISIYLTEDEITERIKELGQQITKDYNNEPVLLVGILKGSVIFLSELAKRIDLPVTIDFMTVSSYGAQTASSGVINVKQDLSDSIEGKNVIIIEDIIDSGNTLNRLIQLLAVRNPKTLKLCTLLDKPSRRQVDIDVDYTGFIVPDKFIVGYGLDWDQKYRNLPYIGIVENL